MPGLGPLNRDGYFTFGMGKPSPYRVERRVYVQGGSLVIAVPRVWANARGLTEGGRVEILFDDFAEGGLLVRPLEGPAEAEASP